MQFSNLARATSAAVAGAILSVCAGTATASPVLTTIDFGTVGLGNISSPYVEDGFELAGTGLFLRGQGNPPLSIAFDAFTTRLTLTRSGGGAFSLVSFDYSCLAACEFSVGGTEFSNTLSTGLDDFVTATPTGFGNVTSVIFSLGSNVLTHNLDNIVVSTNDLAPIPVPAALPLLLAGLGGLSLVARRRRKAG